MDETSVGSTSSEAPPALGTGLGHDRGSLRHRLDDRQPEAFDDRDVGAALRALVDRGERAVVNLAREDDPAGRRDPVASGVR